MLFKKPDETIYAKGNRWDDLLGVEDHEGNINDSIPYVTTNEATEEAMDKGTSVLQFKDVIDNGDLAEYMKRHVYPDAKLDNLTSDVGVAIDPTSAKSKLSAAFDPEYSGPNILGAGATLGTAGLLGATALQSEDADASMVGLIGKNLQELIKAGYPESVAKRIASGELPMDQASRMARAVQQDYDPTDVQYHGSSSDIKEFIPSKNGALSSGVYTTSSPELASEYAGLESGSVVYPLLTRKGAGNISRDEYLARNRYATIADLPQLNSNLRNVENITGIDDVATSNVVSRGDEAIRNTFDPRDIRSVNAAFDPEYKGSNILGAAATMGTTGLLGATAMAPSESQAGEQASGESELDRIMRLTDEIERKDEMAKAFGSASLGDVALDLVGMGVESAAKEIAGLGTQALRSLYLGITGKPKDEQSVYSKITSPDFMPESYSQEAQALVDNYINPAMERAGNAFVENVVYPAAGTNLGQAAISKGADAVQAYQGLSPRAQNFIDAGGAGLLALLSVGTGGRAKPTSVIPDEELLKLIGN
jgi:hypothetical protein